MYNGKELPNVIECTFVRNDLITDSEISFDNIPDPKLDNVNIRNNLNMQGTNIIKNNQECKINRQYFHCRLSYLTILYLLFND